MAKLQTAVSYCVVGDSSIGHVFVEVEQSAASVTLQIPTALVLIVVILCPFFVKLINYNSTHNPTQPNPTAVS